MKGFFRIIICALLSLVLCCGCVSVPEADAWVLFVSAQKGDAALICVNQKYYLVDTGREENADDLVRTLKDYGVTELEGLFLTHSHSDHTGGLKAVANAFTIKAAYRAEFAETNKKGIVKLDKKLNKVGLEATALSAGTSLQLGGGAYISVLAPLELNEDDDNDNSLVFMLNVNGHRVLFTGDMQFAEEETLLESGADIKADVIKVGNHGNPDATLDEFAAAVDADIAVISTNTADDTDSANERVISALGDAEIFITQNDLSGVLIIFEDTISAAYASTVNGY